MLELDQLLRSNELSISLVAALPSLVFAFLTLRALWRAVTPSPPDPRREEAPLLS